MKILLVEDDETTARLLSETLSADNHTVDVATDGQTGWELVERWEYDLLVLDIGLPKLNGLSLCRRAREKGYRMSILMLTARDSNEEVVSGLDAGADDYLTKPFDLSLFLARARALFRRGNPRPSSLYLVRGALCMDTTARRVLYERREIELRRKEYQLLELFLRHRERVFGRDAILDHLWSSEDFPTEGAVTNLIKDLRQRLKAGGLEEDIIETVYGSGYRLKKERGQSPEEKRKIEKTGRANVGDTLAAIDRASGWFRASLPGRFEKLEQIERELKSTTLTPIDRDSAREEVHKLIGGLGTFGLAGGVAPARQMETLLRGDSPLSPVQIEEFSRQFALLKSIVADSPSPVLGSPSDLPMPPEEKKATALVLGDRASARTNLLELLQPWGIDPVYLEKPRELPELLTTIAPDILLLHGEFPSVDPIECCRSIRQNARWGDLPILVVTERRDPDYLRAIFASGADDFIAEPVLGPELVSRVVNHIERNRSRWKRGDSLSERDPLTRIANRRHLDRQLPLVWSRLEREGLSLVLILCEIDEFSAYNLHYGHEAGDTCLQRVARELERHIEPPGDLLARYDGNRFALLFPETPLDRAISIAEEIGKAIAALAIPAPTRDRVTASIGITGTIPTPGKTALSLLGVAEQALQAARWRGGNTYCLYPS